MTTYIVRGYITQELEIQVDADSPTEATHLALIAPKDEWEILSDDHFELASVDEGV
jgi:hypothetical protein